MSDWEVTFWDVGQGDASTIKLPDGSYILIDAGPTAKCGNPISKWFAEHAELVIRKVVITHNHRDHFGGLISLLASGRRIEEVLLLPDKSLYEDPEKKDFRMLRQSIEPRVKAGILACTWFDGAPYEVYSDGVLRLVALRPNKLPVPVREDQNQSSMVLQIESVANLGVPIVVWGGDALLKDVEKCVAPSHPGVLMGPHHGEPQDKFKTQADCAKVLSGFAPGCLFVSVSTQNTYQHPQRYYLFAASSLGATVCCSEITPRCAKYLRSGVDIYPGSMMLGIRKPFGAIQCRGSMRITVSATTGVVFDESQDEFKTAVQSVENRYCKIAV